MRPVRVAALAVVAVLAAATPAAATPIVANQQYQWYYWAAPLLVLALLAVIFGLSFGYLKKVLLPKYRGRKVTE